MEMAQFYMNKEVGILKPNRVNLLKQSYKETKELLASKEENGQTQDFMIFNSL